jgi:hypothetical protein
MLLQELVNRPYGYWIEPTGKIHAVEEFEGHGETAERLGYSWGSLYLNGWVRIVAAGTQPYWNIDAYSKERFTSAVISSLSILLNKESAPVYIDHGIEDNSSSHQYKATNTKQAIAILRGIRIGNPEVERFKI